MQAISERIAGPRIAARMVLKGTLGSTKGTFEQRLQEITSPTPRPSLGKKLREEIDTARRVVRAKFIRLIPGPRDTSAPAHIPTEIYRVRRSERKGIAYKNTTVYHGNEVNVRANGNDREKILFGEKAARDLTPAASFRRVAGDREDDKVTHSYEIVDGELSIVAVHQNNERSTIPWPAGV